MTKHGMTLSERFWRNVPTRPRDPGDCWEWGAGGDGGGYGIFRVGKGKTSRAHRVAWGLSGGTIGEGEEIDHACRNRLCVRPGHLWLVEKFYNARQGSAEYAKRKKEQDRCKYGHLYDGDSFYVNADGHRVCRPCGRRKAALQRERKVGHKPTY